MGQFSTQMVAAGNGSGDRQQQVDSSSRLMTAVRLEERRAHNLLEDEGSVSKHRGNECQTQGATTALTQGAMYA